MNPKIETSALNLYYGENQALKSIKLAIEPNSVTAFIGPSGCGKSTFLRTLNRMNDLIPSVRINGQVLVDGEDLACVLIKEGYARPWIGHREDWCTSLDERKRDAAALSCAVTY
jgi:ABC-type phosphate transport system ATPase subunit